MVKPKKGEKMIKKKEEKNKDFQIPKTLDNLLQGGFTATVLEKKYKEVGKEFRGDIFGYLQKNQDGFVVEQSTGFKTEYGSVTVKLRKNYDVDKDKLIEKVKSGDITIETLINLASFNVEKLKPVIGSDSSIISEKDPTEFLELRANADFKSMIDNKFDFKIERPEKPKAEIPKPKAEKKADPKADPKASLEKIKAAKAKMAKKDNADADLDSILEEEK